MTVSMAPVTAAFNRAAFWPSEPPPSASEAAAVKSRRSHACAGSSLATGREISREGPSSRRARGLHRRATLWRKSQPASSPTRFPRLAFAHFPPPRCNPRPRRPTSAGRRASPGAPPSADRRRHKNRRKEARVPTNFRKAAWGAAKCREEAATHSPAATQNPRAARAAHAPRGPRARRRRNWSLRN
jgi:hypothetical protein